ncbi:hypothetical protein BDW75DRAFT_166334 [Aspergillus navahoensis]
MIYRLTTPLVVGLFLSTFFASRCWIYPAYLIGRRLGVSFKRKGFSWLLCLSERQKHQML